MRSVEVEGHLNASHPALPILKERMILFHPENIFYSNDEAIGNSDLIEDFSQLCNLALCSQGLKVKQSQWKQEVERRREDYKSQVLSLQDVNSALEIDSCYCLYLYDSGRINEAIHLAHHLTDDLKPKRKTTGLGFELDDLFFKIVQFQHKTYKPTLLLGIAKKLVSDGEEEEEKVMALMDDPAVRVEDFYSLLVHKAKVLAEKKEVSKLYNIAALIKAGPQRKAADVDLQRFYFNSIQEEIASVLFRQGKVSECLQALDEIEVTFVKIGKLIELTKESLEQEDVTITQVFIGEIFYELREEILPVVRKVLKTKDKSVSFSSESDQGLKDYGQINTALGCLVDLAKVVGYYREFQQTYTRCIYGDEEEEVPGAIDLAQMIEGGNYLYAWEQVFEAMAQAGDMVGLKTLHQRLSLTIEEGKKEDLQGLYALALTSISPSTARKLIDELSDSPKKANYLARFIYSYLETADNLSAWKKLMAGLIDLEDKLIGDSEEKGDDWNKLLEQDIPEDALDEDEREEMVARVGFTLASGSMALTTERSRSDSFSRASSDLIGDILGLALEREDWQVFKELIFDEHLPAWRVTSMIREILASL